MGYTLEREDGNSSKRQVFIGEILYICRHGFNRAKRGNYVSRFSIGKSVPTEV
jgi:hypothetical protein